MSVFVLDKSILNICLYLCALLFVCCSPPAIVRTQQIERKDNLCAIRAKYPSPFLNDSTEKCFPNKSYSKKMYCDSMGLNSTFTIKSFLKTLKGEITDTLIEKYPYLSPCYNVEFRFKGDSCINVLLSPNEEMQKDIPFDVLCLYRPKFFSQIEMYCCMDVRILKPKSSIFYRSVAQIQDYSVWDDWAQNSFSMPIAEALADIPYPALDTVILLGGKQPLLSFYFCNNMTLTLFFNEDSVSFPNTLPLNESVDFPLLVKDFLKQKGQINMLLDKFSYRDYLEHRYRYRGPATINFYYAKWDNPNVFPSKKVHKPLVNERGEFYWEND